jgi:hypothetical protein
MYMMDQHKHWEELFLLVEFSYKTNYQSAIKTTPFEFLYGRPCQTPLSWDRLEDRVLVGLEVIQEMEDQMKTIRQRVKEAQDRHNIYVDVHCIDHIYEVGDRVFLWVKPHKSSMKGPMAYQLALLDSLRHMHDSFHVSVLRLYVIDSTHVIDMSSL